MVKIYHFNEFREGVNKMTTGLDIINPEQKANEILRDFSSGLIPINPVVIAQKFSIPVENAQFTEPNISGMLEITENKKATIYIKHDDNINRKRFTIAHELGHYFLHYDIEKLFVDRELTFYRNNSEYSNRDFETEANAFAAALLMPAEQIHRVFQSEFYPTVDELAMKFGVSTSAMGYRLIKLGYNKG